MKIDIDFYIMPSTAIRVFFIIIPRNKLPTLEEQSNFANNQLQNN